MLPPYAVVTFTNEITPDGLPLTSEIPTAWLMKGNEFCWWPPVIDASQYIKKCTEPNESKWKQHNIKFEVYCDTLDKARKKAAEEDYTSTEETTKKRTDRRNPPQEDYDSDLSESSTDMTKRKKRIKLSAPPIPPCISTTGTESDDTLCEEIQFDIQNMPIVIAENVNQGVDGDDERDVTLSDKNLPSGENQFSNVQPGNYSLSLKESASNTIVRRKITMGQLIGSETKFKASPSSTLTSEKPTIDKARSMPRVLSHEPITHTPTGDGQVVERVQSMPHEESIGSTPKSIGTLRKPLRYINKTLKFVDGKPDNEITEMRVLLGIQQTLKSMDDRLKKLESRKMSSAADSIEEQLSNLVALPLKTPADLNSLEFDLLNNKDVKHKFTEFVDSIGGKPAKDNVSRILTRIFSNELATQYSWLGLRGNKKLEKLESTSIIRTIVMRAHQVKEDDVEFFYSEWFRHAGQRFKREKKRD